MSSKIAGGGISELGARRGDGFEELFVRGLLELLEPHIEDVPVELFRTHAGHMDLLASQIEHERCVRARSSNSELDMRAGRAA